MGYTIETYSLSELNRISAPNKVVPALFWLIPVGEWEANELRYLWNHFTRGDENSLCQKLGLMLVKNDKYFNNEDKTNNQTTNLSDLTGKLSELLPAGIKSIYDNDYISSSSETSQILILSGSYPQPGWGVLISVSDRYTIERLIKDSLGEKAPAIEEIFTNASNSYNEWKSSLDTKPIIEDVEKLRILIEDQTILSNILKDLSEDLGPDLYKNFDLLKQTIKNKPSEIFKSLFDTADDSYILSLLILQNPDKGEINETLAKFINEHNDKTNNLFKSEKNELFKKAASLLLKLKGNERPIVNFDEWSIGIYESKKEEVKRIVNELESQLKLSIGSLSIKIINIDSSYNSEIAIWKENVEKIRLEFHTNLQAVLQTHIENGPSFLLNIEKKSREEGLLSKSISWDPARMVGWKIISEGIKIATFDLTTHVIEMIPEFSNQHNDDDYNADSLINGSLFTDFVHYISLKDQNFSPRNATKKLLERVIRPNEIRSILTNYQNVNFPNQNHAEMVESLLVKFGWPAEKSNINIKLAECIIENEGKITINNTLTGNDIRTICENYCKDLADTLSSIIGYTAAELSDLVTLKFPDYRPQNMGWDLEIQKLSIGSASFILKALLSEALPDKKETSDNFIKSLDGLRKKFNNLSHDPPIGKTSELVEGIVSILDYTKELISEMPWHFYPVQRNGHQPTVLTGNAWSHSYKHDRQLSIILWSSDNNSESMLVWNPSKVNPVIPDGKIINRPEI